MKKYFSLLIIFFTGLILLTPILARAQEAGGNQDEINALNTEITKRKDTIKQLEETIAKYKSNINQKQLEAVSLKNQVSIIEAQVAQVETSIDLTKEKIKEAELSITALDLSIADKEAVIKRQKVVITQIIQGLLANDQKNFLEIMLTNDSFADFYNQAKYLENVYVDLGRSVKNVRLAKEDLTNQKVQVDAKRQNYENLKIDLEDQRKDLNERVGLKITLLGQTKASEARYQTLLVSLRQQYQLVESEVRTFEDKVRKKLEAQDKIQSSGGELLLSWPVPSRYITAYFHDPEYPYRRVFEHNAVDIRASQGTPIKATAPGYVGMARRCTLASCYSYVLLIHTTDISTVYGHMSSIAVSADQFVERGDIIGYSGGTPGTAGAGPFVTGPHLHFEVRKNGIPVDPLGYLIQ
ncbi:MAG: hypothetical protein A3J93_04510 [Candidatus Magasanikbacteria bacterium RIFOXYC2_FULL_42_28]|uniref:M23ase beta-sheet core domain-containing protein n=1 Tax=Candidatus Magasanikbacteria bacterium RIFOXYC2_FULL_42_28 TaxID=1798704 RepID=A0A1F6NX40_9BACT|nr:MAG: hypothetical protein A3J93_04510 [Candidatus Magasanikbacteria bacterium RIFOXYC2_FULL_42_28]